MKKWKHGMEKELGKWLIEIIEKIKLSPTGYLKFQLIQEDFNKNKLGDFDDFLNSDIWKILRNNGLLIL